MNIKGFKGRDGTIHQYDYDALANKPTENPDSGGNVALTAAQISALDGMFKVCSFASADVSAEYNAFKTAFGISDSGGEEEPDNPEVTLSSISATYSGGDVAVGTAVTALTGIVVTAHYSDGSSKTVTGYTLSGTIAEGNNTVTVSYGGKTTTITVVGVAESGGEEEPEEVTIYEPEANTVSSVAFDQSGTLINVDTGAATSNGSWVATDYLEFPVGSDYLVFLPDTTISVRYALYDSEKVFIKGAVVSGITALGCSIELDENAKYIRISTNVSSANMTIAVGNNMVTIWDDSGNYTIGEDGAIVDAPKAYRISDGYVKIPDGAKLLWWGNKQGYSFGNGTVCVYDSEYASQAYNGGATVANVWTGNFNTNNTIDLTTLSDAAYFKIAVSGMSETNNNPAEQYFVGYC